MIPQRCVHCKQIFDSDAPSPCDGGVYDLNPKTKRMAWQCDFCNREVWEELTPDEREEVELFQIRKDLNG